MLIFPAHLFSIDFWLWSKQNLSQAPVSFTSTICTHSFWYKEVSLNITHAGLAVIVTAWCITFSGLIKWSQTSLVAPVNFWRIPLIWLSKSVDAKQVQTVSCDTIMAYNCHNNIFPWCHHNSLLSRELCWHCPCIWRTSWYVPRRKCIWRGFNLR